MKFSLPASKASYCVDWDCEAAQGQEGGFVADGAGAGAMNQAFFQKREIL